MVNTEIFEQESINNYKIFDEVLKDVNGFIKEKGIKKENIIEYRTENWNNGIWHYKVVISWWEN